MYVRWVQARFTQRPDRQFCLSELVVLGNGFIVLVDEKRFKQKVWSRRFFPS